MQKLSDWLEALHKPPDTSTRLGRMRKQRDEADDSYSEHLRECVKCIDAVLDVDLCPRGAGLNREWLRLVDLVYAFDGESDKPAVLRTRLPCEACGAPGMAGSWGCDGTPDPARPGFNTDGRCSTCGTC